MSNHWIFNRKLVEQEEAEIEVELMGLLEGKTFEEESITDYLQKLSQNYQKDYIIGWKLSFTKDFFAWVSDVNIYKRNG